MKASPPPIIKNPSPHPASYKLTTRPHALKTISPSPSVMTKSKEGRVEERRWEFKGEEWVRLRRVAVVKVKSLEGEEGGEGR